ncbi:MAG TPA: hypothetical protein DCM05_15195 [Elusimicrobia bacterium]|nr:hypothetical protein [Elusimicrobiota bacterium]
MADRGVRPGLQAAVALAFLLPAASGWAEGASSPFAAKTEQMRSELAEQRDELERCLERLETLEASYASACPKDSPATERRRVLARCGVLRDAMSDTLVKYLSYRDQHDFLALASVAKAAKERRRRGEEGAPSGQESIRELAKPRPDAEFISQIREMRDKGAQVFIEDESAFAQAGEACRRRSRRNTLASASAAGVLISACCAWLWVRRRAV